MKKRISDSIQRKNTGQISLLFIICSLFISAAQTACSDEPDSKDFYVYEVTMMDEFLTSRPQYSEFTAVVERAGLLKLLSTYGSYTCFAPDNDVMDEYLHRRGLTSIDQLTDADCDTLARTHLVSTMLSTGDMADGVLPSANMNRRYLEVTHGLDENDNPVVILNEDTHIIFELRDDSLENGIVQPISRVLESSNRMIFDVLKLDERATLFTDALKATGLKDSLYIYKDESYDGSQYETYPYFSDGRPETGFAPEERLVGFTLLVIPDSILAEKYGITTLQQLYEEACRRYDPQYGGEGEAWHDFSQLADRRNPLNRFMSYLILDRNVIDKSRLTPYCPQYKDETKREFGVNTNLVNPEDWHYTLLEHSIINAQRLTKLKNPGRGKLGEHYINRRWDEDCQTVGALVTRPTAARNTALNGIYFYIDDIVAFDQQTTNVTLNRRIRMDLSSFFPELFTNDIRLNGDPTRTEEDITGAYGRNYYFPEGYLDGVKGSGHFIYRRPHANFGNYFGDEWNMKDGDYDLTFRLPPVPSRVTETYQIRLGFTKTNTRGICQIYFDGKPQGIPLDMTKSLSDVYPQLVSSFDELSEDEKTEDRKTLKNLGYYRGPGSALLNNGRDIGYNYPLFYRLVICTVPIDPNEDHYLRFRNVSNNGSDELMLDYIELVPKSVYGVNEDEGTPEDYL